MSIAPMSGCSAASTPTRRHHWLVTGFIFFVAAVPGVLLGATTESASSESASFELFPVVKAVNLKAAIQIAGAPSKSPVVLAAEKEFTIVWKSAGNGCISNWDEELLPASGSAVGTVSKSRAFVITCYGRGAAQTATLQVNIATADLSIGAFSATGLKAAKGKKGFYLTGSGGEDEHTPFILRATIKNLGKLPVREPFKVKYLESTDELDSFVSIAETTVYNIGSGSTLALEDLPRLGNANGDKSYYKVCVDAEEEVEEAKENNNCSKVLGPYSFVQVQ